MLIKLGEYNNSVFLELLGKKGIAYEPAPPYSQHKNGGVERMIRTLNMKARSIVKILTSAHPSGTTGNHSRSQSTASRDGSVASLSLYLTLNYFLRPWCWQVVVLPVFSAAARHSHMQHVGDLVSLEASLLPLGGLMRLLVYCLLEVLCGPSAIPDRLRSLRSVG
jgi:hypothetical protein